MMILSKTLAFVTTLLLFSSQVQSQCTENYGSTASCIEVSTCQTNNGIQYGAATGLCPGASTVRCCTNFLMTNAFTFYKPDENPWQKAALDKLQLTLRWYQEFRTFSCMFRNKTPDGTYCGGEDGMDEIRLSNVATFYNSQLTYQVTALNYLQNVLTSAGLLNTWLTFVKEFRNVDGSTVPGNGFLPPTPDTSGNQGTCSSPYNGFKGHCISTSACTGATFNGLCPGSSKCCVPETTRANPKREYVSQSTFNTLFQGISTTRAAALRPYFNEALDSILSDNPSSTTRCHRIAAFAAQIGHESAGLAYFEEIASGAAYEGRCSDLGNCQSGDGMRFKGRGPIQLTGRANYRSAGGSLGVNLEASPERVCFPSMGFKTTAFFWTRNNLNRFCTGNYNDFTALSRAINGGFNGIADRRSRWATAKSLLGCPQAITDSVVLQDAGLQGTEASQEDVQSFAQEFCAANLNVSSATQSATSLSFFALFAIVVFAFIF